MAGDEQGRDALAAWRAARPQSFYDATPNLAATLRATAGPTRAAAIAPSLEAFGTIVAQVIEPAVSTLERHRDLPRLAPYDGIGRLVEAVEFHPAYDIVGRAVWGSGLLAANRGGAGAYEQAALFYLLSHAGEGGHACPAVCTAGLARALERRGSDELKSRFLGGLSETDYDRCLRGSQFLTEVQGGSDVGANAAVAVPDGAEPGAWRVSGEKWFCSVADADLFAVTARPRGASVGTRGLGCFVVPRSVDGSAPNGFRIRRLKDKLGTRCLASAEIDFDGALGWPIGDVTEGFHVAVEELLNTSRWLNAVGSTGIMRRSYLEASSFARHRRAFGRAVSAFPLVRAQLASMKVDEYAALSSTMLLTGLLERLDAGSATTEEQTAHRVLVNANKFVTSIDATDVAHRGIEVLGGNGTIEDFSALPRLYRDAIVYESWEGTHNVLCAQVQRDLGRPEMLDQFVSWFEGHAQRTGAAAAIGGAAGLGLLRDAISAAVREPEQGAVDFRSQLTSVVRIIQAGELLAAAQGGDPERSAIAELFVARQVRPLHDVAARGGAGLFDGVVGADLE